MAPANIGEDPVVDVPGAEILQRVGPDLAPTAVKVRRTSARFLPPSIGIGSCHSGPLFCRRDRQRLAFELRRLVAEPFADPGPELADLGR